MPDFAVLGKPVPQRYGDEVVTGKAIYVIDQQLPSMLYARLKRSPYPHANIVSIDTRKAESLPGVKAVITAKDLPDQKIGDRLDYYILARQKVVEVGQPVAAVAAETPEIAEEAIDLIDVTYEELPAIFDVEEAVKPDPPVILWKLGKDVLDSTYSPRDMPRPNVSQYCKYVKGDVEEGFKAADLIVENRYSLPAVHHCQAERHNCLVNVEPDGTVVIWESSQGIYHVAAYSRLLGIPLSKVRIIASRHIGGGFGGKQSVQQHGAVVAALALKTKRPVKYEETLGEQLGTEVPRPMYVIYIKDGVKKDGTIVARQATSYVNGGGHTFATTQTLMTLTGHTHYSKIPNFKLESFMVYTNLPRRGSYRGNGSPEQGWAIEQQMDIIAEKLGIDPVELRMKHLVEGEDTSIIGDPLYGSAGAKETLQKTADAIGWGNPIEKVRGPWRRGIGIASGNKYTGGNWNANVNVKICQDETVEVQTGVCDIGTGVITVVAQCAAEEFGLPMENIRVTNPDTGWVPNGGSSGSSRQTFFAGNSVILACQDAKRKLFEKAAGKMNVKPEELATKGGLIYIKAEPKKTMRIRDLFTTPYPQEDDIIGRGEYYHPVPNPAAGYISCLYYCFMAAAADVEVNVETGAVNVRRFVNTCDVVPVNRAGVEGQLQGALSQGLGVPLMEETHYDKGQPLDVSLIDYKIPTFLDVPNNDNVDVIIVPTPHPMGLAGGQKGVAEGVITAALAAVGNAIYNAIGVRFYNTAITPDVILKALQKRDIE